jgi:hypothetical protein
VSIYPLLYPFNSSYLLAFVFVFLHLIWCYESIF